jgi:mannose-P-dolichol utilization defect 1
LLPVLQIALTIPARLPQIWINFTNGHTGQLAFLTVFLSMGGAIVRVFTTIKELGPTDPQVYGFAVGASLSFILFLQVGGGGGGDGVTGYVRVCVGEGRRM